MQQNISSLTIYTRFSNSSWISVQNISCPLEENTEGEVRDGLPPEQTFWDFCSICSLNELSCSEHTENKQPKRGRVGKGKGCTLSLTCGEINPLWLHIHDMHGCILYLSTASSSSSLRLLLLLCKEGEEEEEVQWKNIK